MPLPSLSQMTTSSLPFAVFVDSNLDTHLALLVSASDTITDLKRSISAEHALCFPHIGEIIVQAVKVKRKGAYYHLSDSMFVRSVFIGVKGAWFLHVDFVVRKIKHQDQAAGNFENKNEEWLDGDHQVRTGPLQTVVADSLEGIAVNMQLDGKDVSRNNAVDVPVTQSKLIDDVDLLVHHHTHTEELRHNVFISNSSGLYKEIEVQQPKCQCSNLEMPCSVPNEELIVELVENRDKRGDIEVPNIGTNNASDSAGSRMKERTNVAEHNDSVDRNSPHTSLERKQEKIEKGGFHEDDNQECRTEHDIQTAQLITETSKLDMTPSEAKGKNGASLSDEPKKKKKKRSKPQNENGYTIPCVSDIDLPGTTADHAETGSCSRTLEKTEATHTEDVFIETNEASSAGERKKKRKKISKFQNEAGANIPSASVRDCPETTVDHAETELCSPSVEKTEIMGHTGVAFIETNHQGLVSQRKDSTEESDFASGKIMRDVTNGDSMGIVSDITSIGKSDNSQSRLSNNASKENLPSQALETDRFEELISKGKHKEVDAEDNTNRECILTGATEIGSGVRNESILEKKKNREKSSKTSASTTMPLFAYEPVPEENIEVVPGSRKKGALNAVDEINIKGEAYNSSYYAKLDSNDSLDSMIGGHKSEIKEHENMEFTNLQSDDLKSNNSLKDQADVNCEEKLEDKGSQRQASLGEMGAMDDTISTISKVKQSHRNKKKFVSSELTHDDSNKQQEFAQALVKGTDDRIEVMALKPNLPNKEPKVVSSVGEDPLNVYPANEDLAINSKGKTKTSRQLKRKSEKLKVSDGISYSGLDKQNTPRSSPKVSGTLSNPSGRDASILNGSVQDVTKVNALSSFSNSINDDIRGENEELERNEVDLPSENAGSKTSKISVEALEARNEKTISKTDLDKINFHDYFIPKSVQHESVVSAQQLSSGVVEPRKQHKHKPERKRKLDIKPQDLNHQPNSNKECMLEPEPEYHDHDLNVVDPLTQSATRLTNNEISQNGAVERTSSSGMHGDISYDTKMKKKKKVENYKHDSHHKISLSQDKQTHKIVHHQIPSPQKSQAEMIAFSENNKTLNSQDNKVLKVRGQRPAKSNSVTNNTELHIRASQGLSSYAIDALQEDANVNLAASSYSTEETPRRLMVTVRKKPTSKLRGTLSKFKQNKTRLASGDSLDEEFENDRSKSQVRKKPTSKFTTLSKSKQEKTLLAPSGTIFNHATTYSSEDEFERVGTPTPDGSSTSVGSDQGLDSLVADADSAAFCKKDGIDGEIMLSKSKKGAPLDSILRSSSIYKKAKALASQSQAEDSESQPVEAVSLH